MLKSKSIISNSLKVQQQHHTTTIKLLAINYNDKKNYIYPSCSGKHFHMTTFNPVQQTNNYLTNVLKECAGLNRKELDLFEQLGLDESDMEELQVQISETSYQAAMERFNRIVNNKCVFIERDESIDLSKFSIKLVEFAASKVKTPIKRDLSSSSIIHQEKQVKEEIIKQVIKEEETVVTPAATATPTQHKESIINIETIQKEVTTPISNEEPSSISALVQEEAKPEEEDEESREKSQFQLPTESYSNWDKEITLYVMKGVIRKGGAGMKVKQIQCLQRFEINGRVLESVRLALEKESKQVVCEKLIRQLAIPNYKPTPSIVSKIVEWVENRK
ncbi:predicted protein [Naegleria gruberi]|uniref:Predicted protein n=1 Tax=Naegleria gruberi TaxID=5762 RepID=D2W0T4_NAEGR|nr:uncharacterized protein NAEGRDRAFT_74972 [Naegleria gruberi]EFC37393.1 predicted protein [Naegleria gruberi]|eukprot:XP_002670137.1 predicted protein [Naegleria gruberi strain NEG-M]